MPTWQEIQSELDAFRKQVRDVAIRVHEENKDALCENGLNEVLEELGLPVKKPDRVSFVAQIEVTFEGEPRGWSENQNRGSGQPDRSWITESVSYRFSDSSGSVEVMMDSDWDEVEVQNVEVSAIEEIDVVVD